MKIVFIGCEPFKGTDRCGFQYSFYKENFNIGDIFNTTSTINDDYVLVYYKNNPLSLPRKYFVTIQEWRENRINQILK